MSLDAFRGFAILLMLLVNNFGVAEDTPLQLRHAGWGGGIHLADMAFPWFLFCVGLAIPFSAAGARRRGVPGWLYDLRVLKRALILILLGALLDITDERVFVLFSVGVLQTIAIAYLIGSLLYDLSLHKRIAIAFILLLGYWAAVKFVPVPGMGKGSFEEGKNLILYLNRTYLAQVGLWNLPRIVPTSALVLIGTAIGDLMLEQDLDRSRKAVWLMIVGAALSALGYLWNLSLPFNKPIWTPSYILFSAGTGAFLLGLLDYIIDIAGCKRWAFPLVVFGMNAILAYVMPIAFKSVVLRPLDIYVGGWLRVSLFVLFWWLVMYALYRKKWFIKV